jgi:O-antigen/teichoic acid export membrane protein
VPLSRRFHEVLRNLTLKTGSLGIEKVCRLLVVIASARALGQAAFGRFVFASTVTALLAFGTDLGLGVWTTRELARKRLESDRVVGVGLVLRGFASVPYAVVVTLTATLAVHGETGVAVLLLGVSALLAAFVDHFGAILRGQERFGEEARLIASRAVLTSAGGLAGLALGRSLAALCCGLMAASLGSFGYGAAMLLGRKSVARLPSTSDLVLAKTALAQSLPIWLAGLLSLLYFRIDTVFVKSFAGDSALGAYGAAYKLFEGSMVFPAILLAVIFPRLARAQDDPSDRRGLEVRTTAALLTLGLAGAVVGFFGGSELVRLVFGRGFEHAVASLRILALGVPLVYANYGLTHFLIARDRARVTTLLALMMLAANVGLDVAFIPSLLGPGAAWATVLSEVALSTACLAALTRDGRTDRAPSSAPVAAKRGQRAA